MKAPAARRGYPTKMAAVGSGVAFSPQQKRGVGGDRRADGGNVIRRPVAYGLRVPAIAIRCNGLLLLT